MEKLTFPWMTANTAPCFDRAAYEQRRVEAYNATTGNLTDYDCPKCRNRGNFARLRSDNTLGFFPCECMKIRTALQKASNSGLRASLGRYTFGNFIASSVQQQRLKDGVMNYAQNGSGWLMICGPSGSGKTHLCTAVCGKRLFRQQNVRYMSWREEVNRLKAPIQEEEERRNLLKELKTAELLYIDDLFKTGQGPDGQARPTPADINLAFEILNYRYLHNLDTILSTELTTAQLLRIDEATASRILERCGEHAYTITPGRNRNYRLASRFSETGRPEPVV